MATITLKYNARNKLARKTIDYLLSLGIFETESKPRPGAEITRKAIEDVERGNVIHCGSFEEFVTRMSNV